MYNNNVPRIFLKAGENTVCVLRHWGENRTNNRGRTHHCQGKNKYVGAQRQTVYLYLQRYESSCSAVMWYKHYIYTQELSGTTWILQYWTVSSFCWFVDSNLSRQAQRCSLKGCGSLALGMGPGRWGWPPWMETLWSVRRCTGRFYMSSSDADCSRRFTVS